MGEAVAQESERPSPKGRADVKVLALLEHELAVDSDPPPEWHAVIVGWPEAREAMIELAKLVAKASPPFKQHP